MCHLDQAKVGQDGRQAERMAYPGKERTASVEVHTIVEYCAKARTEEVADHG